MALGFSTTIRDGTVNEITNAVDAVSNGKLLIYTTPRPATGAASGATLLAELTFSPTSFGAPSSGSITANAITGDAAADATGTAAWFRITDSTGAAVLDGEVGTSGSDLNLNTTSLTVGVQVDVTSLVLTAGNV